MSIEMDNFFYEKIKLHFQEQYIQYVIEYLDRNMGDAIYFYGEDALRETIKIGREKAKIYGITNPRDLCLYIYIMCTNMGSFFDENPLYPWAKKILTDKHLSSNQKVDELLNSYFTFFNLSNEQIKKNTKEQIQLIRTEAFFTLNKNQNYFQQVFNLLKNTISYKIKKATIQNYNLFVKKNILLAEKYGIQESVNQAALVGLAFFSGYGIFLDPRFSTTRKSFLNNNLSEEDKMELVQIVAKDQLKKKILYLREVI